MNGVTTPSPSPPCNGSVKRATMATVVSASTVVLTALSGARVMSLLPCVLVSFIALVIVVTPFRWCWTCCGRA